MQQTVTIDGRPAIVSYLDEMLVPVADSAEAKLIEALFLDAQGGSLFLKPQPPQAKEYDESQHPRDDRGRWTDAGGVEGGSDAGSVAAPNAVPAVTPTSTPGNVPPIKKEKSKLSDFNKDEVNLDRDTNFDPKKQEKFLKVWNDNIDQAPAEFRKQFLGGLPGSMTIRYDEGNEEFGISGHIHDKNGNNIAEYSRDIDFKHKIASSNYFKVLGKEQGHGVGKQLLAGNMDVYRKLGMKRVDVRANIDVGGYAWARYGYVPTQSSWNELRGYIERKLTRPSGGGRRPAPSGDTYTPSSWEELSSDQQDDIYREWARLSYDEFYESEVESWRDSGRPLNDAKEELAKDFDSKQEWALDALQKWREKRGEIPSSDEYDDDVPFTNKQILDAMTVDYSDRYEEGRADPEFSFDDSGLTEPEGYDPDQMALPGIDLPEPHEYLTQDMRDEIDTALTKAFNDKAESDADSVDPPNYLADGVSDYQSEYWDQLDDHDRFRQADRLGLIPDIEIPADEEEEQAQPEPPQLPLQDVGTDALLKLTRSADPKALWAIADSTRGKELLLNTGWAGRLDLSDKEQMARFDAYVHKKKAA